MQVSVEDIICYLRGPASPCQQGEVTSPSSPNREKFETLGRSDFDHPSIKMDDSFQCLQLIS